MISVNGTSVLETLEALCALGPRWMGSKGAEAAKRMLIERLQDLGLSVAVEPFSYLSYTCEEASLEVDGRSVVCEPLVYSASTPQPLATSLVYGGQCSREDLAALRASGVDLSTALVISDNLRSFVAFPEVQAAGAAGMILITGLEEPVIRCGSCNLAREPVTIPGISISGSDGRGLIEHLRSARGPLEAVLRVRGETRESVGENVIGRIPGREGRKILVTAHYDSMWNGVHAMDNAAGAASVLGLARVLPKLLDCPLDFVLFGAEELGLWGSYGYLERHREELSTIRAVVNLDAMGSSRSLIEIGVTEDIRDLCVQEAEASGIPVDCWNTPPRAASDTHGFAQAGVPSIWIANCGADPYYHTPLDTPEGMSPARLGQCATLAARFVVRLGM